MYQRLRVAQEREIPFKTHIEKLKILSYSPFFSLSSSISTESVFGMFLPSSHQTPPNFPQTDSTLS